MSPPGKWPGAAHQFVVATTPLSIEPLPENYQSRPMWGGFASIQLRCFSGLPETLIRSVFEPLWKLPEFQTRMAEAEAESVLQSVNRLPNTVPQKWTRADSLNRLMVRS